MDRFIFLDKKQVAKLHDIVLEKSWGLPWVINIGLIDSVLEHIKNDDYYPEFIDKLTHLLYGITMNHSFTDWNKRTALATSACFISLNYNPTIAGSFIDFIENIVVQIADGVVSKKVLHKYLTTFFETQEADESVLVEIIRAIKHTKE